MAEISDSLRLELSDDAVAHPQEGKCQTQSGQKHYFMTPVNVMCAEPWLRTSEILV